MSTTPADRRTAAPRPARDLAWTTHRDRTLVCARCRRSFVLSYKYRFVEGLVATLIRCPAAGCSDRFEYYLPVNAFDVVVAAAGVTSPREA
jgi:hypothetical protein